MLTQGWHSGPIFGAPAAAAASSKLMGLNSNDIESTIGISCTQAARNGLFGALIARTGYVGIKKVFERTYGGLLAMFSQSSTQTPKFKIHEVTGQLGSLWHTNHIRVKLYACVGGCHSQIECLERMQQAHPACFATENLTNIKKITVYLSAPIYGHDGWVAEERPMTATGSQMNAAFIGAIQLVDRQVLLAQFADSQLDRDEVWDLTHKTECFHSGEFEKPNHICGARIKVEFDDGVVVEDAIAMPKGFDPILENSDIQTKWRKLAATVIDQQRLEQIERLVLGLEDLEDISGLIDLLAQPAARTLS